VSEGTTRNIHAMFREQANVTSIQDFGLFGEVVSWSVGVVEIIAPEVSLFFHLPAGAGRPRP